MKGKSILLAAVCAAFLAVSAGSAFAEDTKAATDDKAMAPKATEEKIAPKPPTRLTWHQRRTMMHHHRKMVHHHQMMQYHGKMMQRHMTHKKMIEKKAEEKKAEQASK